MANVQGIAYNPRPIDCTSPLLRSRDRIGIVLLSMGVRAESGGSRTTGGCVGVKLSESFLT